MMKKRKRISFGIPAAAFLAAAGVLFAGSAVGSTRAALSIYSDEYQTTLDVPELDVTLERDDDGSYQPIEGKGLLGDVGDDGAKAVIGKTYDEKLRVSNTGELDSYVRVRIYRSWVDGNGKPIQTLAPELIKLNVPEGSGWAAGEESLRSEEMMVLYYMRPLRSGESTPDFMTGYQISSDIWKKADENGYAYADRSDETGAESGPDFKLEVEVDSVQMIGGSEAIMSAWGRSMSADENGDLSFGGYEGSGWDVSGNDVESGDEPEPGSGNQDADNQ